MPTISQISATSWKGFETAENPYRTHPAEILRSHPIEKYGCTSCHGGQGWAIDVDDAVRFVWIADRDRANRDARAEPGLDRLCIVLEQLDHAAANVAEAQQRDTDRARHHRPRLYE